MNEYFSRGEYNKPLIINRGKEVISDHILET